MHYDYIRTWREDTGGIFPDIGNPLPTKAFHMNRRDLMGRIGAAAC